MGFKYKLYIFDLDDTLYNEHDYVNQAFSNVANYISSKTSYNSVYLYNKMLEYLNIYGRGKIFDRLITELKLNVNNYEEMVARLIEVYRNTLPSLKLYNDAEVILNSIKKHNYLFPDNLIKTGIITDGFSKVQHNKINALNVINYFDDIIVTDDLDSASKPSTIPYQIFLDKYQYILPSECVYIGDNPSKDFIGAKKLKMHTIRIIREHGDNMTKEVDESIDADERISLLTELEVLWLFYVLFKLEWDLKDYLAK